MRQNKKPRITPIQDSGLITPPRAEQQRNSIRFPFVSNLFTQINIGGSMSEQGADKYGENISSGIKFFLCCGGIALLAVAFAFGYYLIK
ncbi:hypothetical protein BKK51_11735 [Rodentibacter trehalosifermentans]|uniref:Uncharacterized protein n=1 Tax=Rodentibacter trehalosifermentans TaxID=1908263 RepID=A0A1V3IMC4_9PAST|nr:hypothetical protein BKK51_11735 [Rodentibacter trehalosifermentans]